MTKRFFDRVFEVGACQQLFLPSGTSGCFWDSAIPHTRLRVNQGYPWLPIAATVKPDREKAIRWHAGCHNAGARGHRHRRHRLWISLQLLGPRRDAIRQLSDE